MSSTEKRNLPERTLKSTRAIEVVLICLPFSQQSSTTNWLCSQAELKVYIYSGRQLGSSSVANQSFLCSIASHLPGCDVKGNPRPATWVVEVQLSGQLFGRHQAAVVPKGEEVESESSYTHLLGAGCCSSLEPEARGLGDSATSRGPFGGWREWPREAGT